MDFKYLLTGFDGRIGRQQFWIGVLCLIVLSFILIFVLGLLLSWFLPAGLISLIGTLIILYPAAAIYTKRLHDREKPQSPWLYIFIGPSLLYALGSAFGIGFSQVELAAGQPPATVPTGIVGMIIVALVVIVGIWALVELGFRKGTEGDNAYGPDPTN